MSSRIKNKGCDFIRTFLFINLLNFIKMEKTKFKIGDVVIYKIPMYESFLYQKATITKVFKNEKVKLEFRTLSGSLCKSKVEASELVLF